MGFYQVFCFLGMFGAMASVVFSLCAHGNRQWLLKTHTGGIWNLCKGTEFFGDCGFIGESTAELLDHSFGRYRSIRLFIILCQLAGIGTIFSNLACVKWKKEIWAATLNVALSGIFFFFYLLFASITQGTFRRAYKVKTENGWIPTVMWLGWILSLIVFGLSICVMYFTLNKKKKRNKVATNGIAKDSHAATATTSFY